MSSVSALSSNNYYVQQQGGISQDFQALQKALNSSSLTNAQQAFSTFQQDLASVGQAQAAQQTSSTNVQNDMQAIGQALNSGDIAGAQQAFSSLRQDLQHVRHGHHHHHAQSVQSSQSTQNTGSVSTGGTSISDGADASTFANLIAQDIARLLGNNSAYSSAAIGSNVNLIA